MPDLTLMAVHAHPDDEATGTGGVLAKYASEGVRTVLVTCTDGACGDGPGGIKPDDPSFEHDKVVALRTTELEASCTILGVRHLELLGYRDSGMMGWPQNDAQDAFWNTPVAVAAARLGELMERYRPDVVVTYDPNGFYGHPDHIQAHRITMAAADATGIPAKLYWTTVPRSRFAELGQRLREAGVDWEPPPATSGDGQPEVPSIGADDDEITTRVDTGAWVDQKYDALAAHASQGDNIFFLRMGRELFADVMSTETFIRVRDRTDAAVPETDLFAGLR